MLAKSLWTDPPAGGLVQLLSAPEGSLRWTAGMRGEIQSGLRKPKLDREYVSDCLRQLLRSRGWRLLQDGTGTPFSTFTQFCCAPRPQGLGLARRELEALLPD